MYAMYCINQYLYQCYSNNIFGVVSIAQLVEVTDSAELGGVAAVYIFLSNYNTFYF